jgi:hypothetical protein
MEGSAKTDQRTGADVSNRPTPPRALTTNEKAESIIAAYEQMGALFPALAGGDDLLSASVEVARAYLAVARQAGAVDVGAAFPTTIEEVAIEEARQAGEREGERYLEAFLDKCEGFLNTEGTASSDAAVAEVFERFIDEERESLKRRRGGFLPSAEELLAKIAKSPAASEAGTRKIVAEPGPDGGWTIIDKNTREELYQDGQWAMRDYSEMFPTRDAALAFARAAVGGGR